MEGGKGGLVVLKGDLVRGKAQANFIGKAEIRMVFQDKIAPLLPPLDSILAVLGYKRRLFGLVLGLVVWPSATRDAPAHSATASRWTAKGRLAIRFPFPAGRSEATHSKLSHASS